MPVFAVIYRYDPARHDLRLAKRAEHRATLGALVEAGTILAGGAWEDDEAPGALLVARGADRSEIETAFDADPYYRHGVLAGREIRQWAQLWGPWS